MSRMTRRKTIPLNRQLAASSTSLTYPPPNRRRPRHPAALIERPPVESPPPPPCPSQRVEHSVQNASSRPRPNDPARRGRSSPHSTTKRRSKNSIGASPNRPSRTLPAPSTSPTLAPTSHRSHPAPPIQVRRAASALAAVVAHASALASPELVTVSSSIVAVRGADIQMTQRAARRKTSMSMKKRLHGGKASSYALSSTPSDTIALHKPVLSTFAARLFTARIVRHTHSFCAYYDLRYDLFFFLLSFD